MERRFFRAFIPLPPVLTESRCLRRRASGPGCPRWRSRELPSSDQTWYWFIKLFRKEKQGMNPLNIRTVLLVCLGTVSIANCAYNAAVAPSAKQIENKTTLDTPFDDA